ncbi:MAG: DUF642 domain-containing protein [Planctomycetota bacterium]|nr:MAG: DUF642 domain-containing protein [Planctomycetota bacterium]
MSKAKSRIAVALLLLCLTAPGLRASELLINGSFELPVIPTIDQEFAAPSTDIVGWAVTERTVNINRTSAIFGTAHDGDQMLDINGSNNGTIEQSFATSIGGEYLLTLYYANNPNPSMASPSYDADVTLFGTGTLYTEFITHSGSTAADMEWTFLSHQFAADSTTTTLQLRSRMLGFNGVVFDSVSIVEVPEPGALTLILPGLVAAYMWRRARRLPRTTG